MPTIQTARFNRTPMQHAYTPTTESSSPSIGASSVTPRVCPHVPSTTSVSADDVRLRARESTATTSPTGHTPQVQKKGSQMDRRARHHDYQNMNKHLRGQPASFRGWSILRETRTHEHIASKPQPIAMLPADQPPPTPRRLTRSVVSPAETRYSGYSHPAASLLIRLGLL